MPVTKHLRMRIVKFLCESGAVKSIFRTAMWAHPVSVRPALTHSTLVTLKRSTIPGPGTVGGMRRILALEGGEVKGGNQDCGALLRKPDRPDDSIQQRRIKDKGKTQLSGEHRAQASQTHRLVSPPLKGEALQRSACTKWFSNPRFIPHRAGIDRGWLSDDPFSVASKALNRA